MVAAARKAIQKTPTGAKPITILLTLAMDVFMLSKKCKVFGRFLKTNSELNHTNYQLTSLFTIKNPIPLFPRLDAICKSAALGFKTPEGWL